MRSVSKGSNPNVFIWWERSLNVLTLTEPSQSISALLKCFFSVFLSEWISCQRKVFCRNMLPLTNKHFSCDRKKSHWRNLTTSGWNVPFQVRLRFSKGIKVLRYWKSRACFRMEEITEMKDANIFIQIRAPTSGIFKFRSPQSSPLFKVV